MYLAIHDVSIGVWASHHGDGFLSIASQNLVEEILEGLEPCSCSPNIIDLFFNLSLNCILLPLLGPHHVVEVDRLVVPTVYDNMRFDLEDKYQRKELLGLGNVWNVEVVLVQFTEFITTGSLLIIN